MRSFHNVRLMLFGCVSALAIAVPAAAQTESQAEDGTQEIIVTATRQEQALIDAPVAVDVVTGEDIAKLNLFDIKEVQNAVPGLSLENSDGRSNIATLRGISFNPDSGSSDAVQVYFNEIDVDANTFFGAIYDIGQIEVLRGPQGLFRGRVTPAGAIVIGSARPDLTRPTGYIQAAGTDQLGRNVQGAASLPIVEDKLAIRAALLYDLNRGGQVRNIDGRKSHNTTMSGRMSIAWAPSPAFRADLVYQYTTSEFRPFRAVFGPGNRPSPNAFFPLRSGPAISVDDRLAVSEGPLSFKNNTHLVTLNASYDLDWAEIVVNGGYQNTRLDQLRDQDEGNSVPQFTSIQRVQTPYDLWSAEVRFQSAGKSRFTWALSANFDHGTFDSVRVTQRNDFLLTDPFGTIFPGMTAPGPVPPQIFVTPVEVFVVLPIKSESYAIAGTVGYEIVDGVTVTGGLRQTWGKTTRNQQLRIPAFNISTSNLSTVKPKALTGGASISWEVNNDLTVYANYGRAFRPGVAATGVSTPLDADLLFTPDETSDGYEIGLKSYLFDRKVTLNLAAFYQTFDNYIDFAGALTTNSSKIPGRVDTSTAPLPTFGNVVSKGVEAQFTFRPNSWFDLGINAAYADTKYDNASVYCNDYNGDGIADANGTPRVPGTRQVALCTRNDRVADVPKFSISANSEVRFETGGITPFIRGLVSYRPGFYSPSTDFDYRTFTKVDLFLGVRGADERWEVNVFAKNLLDQARVIRAGQGLLQVPTNPIPDLASFGSIPFNSGYRSGTISAPREFGLTARFSW